ncbi:Receptor-like protein 12 [Nymphaea thermarum]|nr:Receptor-like protein 12 [Nymphaea thermarum]
MVLDGTHNMPLLLIQRNESRGQVSREEEENKNQSSGLGDLMAPTLLWARHGLWMLVVAFFVAPPAQVAALCLKNQSSALLEFKQGLALLQSDALGSWTNGTDCCSWSGVTCNSSTGFVIFLQLSGVTGSSPSARTRPNPSSFSDSLFDLRRLRFLDLSYNQFNGSIPFRLVELTELAHLNLSNTDFSGQVPSQISQMTWLVSLDLSDSYLSSQPLNLGKAGFVDLVRNLSHLTDLRLDGINISMSGVECISALASSLPNLRHLSLSSCSISGPMNRSILGIKSLAHLDLSRNNMSKVPEFLINLTLLRHLGLSSCSLGGVFPNGIFRLPYLQHLDISNNPNLQGSFPEILPVSSSLLTLSLSSTSLSGTIPNSIGNLTELRILKMSSCNFTGSIPSSFSKLTRLQIIDMSFNDFTGQLPSLSPSTVTEIDLSMNRLLGPIPESFSELQGLTTLKLDNNLLTGPIPLALLNLPSLKTVDLSSNNLTGSICQFTNASSLLETLDLSNNSLIGEIPSWLWGLRNLQHLNLSHNLLTGLEKPMDIGNRNSLVMLDLHSNFLGPDLPPFPPNAIFLDFSSNKFTSSIPSTIDSTFLLYLSISNNGIKGTIPESLCYSAILNVLDLSNNSLVGSIPYCLTNSSELSILNLRENQLTGTIPDEFDVDCSLRTLNLRGNRLTGRLPASLCNCSALEVLDLSNNNLTGGFPTQLGCLNNFRVLALRSNKLSGPVVAPVSNKKAFPLLQIIDISGNNFSGNLDPRFFELLTGMMKKSRSGTAKLLGFRFLINIYYQDTVAATIKGVDFQMIKIMNILTSIDLSNNHFSGEIPEEVGKFSGLVILNMSKNSINGPIPNSMGNLSLLESLDLSENSLSGNIPQELAKLTFLSVLNLSFNDLEGKIPETGQFATFSADSFMGNPGLCAMQLDISCTHSGEYGARNHNTLNGKTAVDPLIYIAAEVGFIAGLAAILILLFMVEKVRKWWCGLVDRFAESSALLKFKQGLSLIQPERLNSWEDDTDCCFWIGVTCNSSTGFVVSLELSGITGPLTPIRMRPNVSSFSPSIFELQRLRVLDLSYNLFEGPIPSRLVELTELALLNLSNAGFSGQVPAQISQMTWLVSLDLSTTYLNSPLLKLENPSFVDLLKNLKRLKDLRLDGINISMGGADCSFALASLLPNLQILSLSNCSISGPMNESILLMKSLSHLDLSRNNISKVPGFFANLTELQFLGLSSSSLWGSFPPSIFRLPHLRYLDISNNPNMGGSFPDTIPASSRLQFLKLSYTNMSGSIPDSIGNLTELRILLLRSCRFTGNISASLSSLTRLEIIDMSLNSLSNQIPPLASRTIEMIDLSTNNLTGTIPESFGELKRLTQLFLCRNLLTGPIPSALLNLPSLTMVTLYRNSFTGFLPQFTNALSLLQNIDVRNNLLSGTIPSTISSLSHLRTIVLASNNFTGTFDISLLMGLKNLSQLDLSGNRLTVAVDVPRSSQDEMAQLATLQLSTCNIGKFPEWLRNQRILNFLDLGNNNISGSVPSWLWGMSSLRHLNLSNNMLTILEEPMAVGNSTSSLVVLDLHSNLLGPDLPPFPPNAIFLDFSSNRYISTFPLSIDSPFLFYLSLSNNNITGSIPESLCKSEILNVLDLSSNSLVGSIPYCLTNSSELFALDLGKNQLGGPIPDMFGSGCSLRILNLNGNRFGGSVPTSLSKCWALEVLDFSNNELTDEFPSWLGSFTQLRVLSLRSNHFYGSVVPPPHENPFPALQIIDVSSNNLSGTLEPGLFRILRGMMKREPNDRRGEIMGVEVFSNLYYENRVTMTIKGLDYQMDKMLNLLTSMDLSSNRFSGEIPNEIGTLEGLVVLNMSNNELVGPIPQPLANLLKLESLDLSRNSLSGNIPVAPSRLTFLAMLNLSFNNLQGKIPEGNQFLTFDALSFEGNAGLCGPPLTRTCTDTRPPDITGDRKIDFAPLYIAAEMGFIVGLACVVVPLFLVGRVRRWWYASFLRARFLLVLALGFFITSPVQVSALCLSNQSSALLEFKRSLALIPQSQPHAIGSWRNGTDCCSWSGVTCNSSTGFVISLQLSGAGRMWPNLSNFSDSLLDLRHLRFLELSNVPFNGSIPSRLGELTELTHLNLSNGGFTGQIPSQLSQMTSLVSLDLSTSYFSSQSLKLGKAGFIHLLKNLGHLTDLRLDGTNISMSGAECSSALASSLPKLQTLSLCRCSISGPMNKSIIGIKSLGHLELRFNDMSKVPDFFINLTSLRYLGLSSCSLGGTFPDGIFRLPYLEHLDISNNPNLSGSFPEILPVSSSLLTLILSSTNLGGTIPNSIGNLTELRILKMSSCNFTGPIPSSLSNLTRLQIIDMSFNGFTGRLPSLSASTITDIDLSTNRLSGPIPESFSELQGLTTLKLGDNLLTVPIPSGLLNLPSLKTVALGNNKLKGSLSQFTNASSLLEILDLINNSLSGEIPSCITSLSQLKAVDLSFNNFSGTVDISLFMGLKNLSQLDLSENRLTVAVDVPRRSQDEMAQLTNLQLRSCNIRKFPEWIRNQRMLTLLDLANNNISGSLPSWLWGMSSLQHLNLSHNMLTILEEPIAVGNSTSSLVVLDLHSNLLGPDLPPFPPNAIFLDFSSNRYVSNIPSNVNSTFLRYLSISDSNITGSIPESLCNSEMLMVVDLSNNRLEGSIPYCLRNSTKLFALDLGKNQLSGPIPDVFGSVCSLMILNLNSNRLRGSVPKSLSLCRNLKVLDLSNNQLTGEFPSWLGGLTKLQLLSLRSNHFYGSVVLPLFENPFPALQIIDVSSNNLSGTLQPGLFRILRAMMEKRGPNDRTAKLMGVEVFSNAKYENRVTMTIKGSNFQMDKMLNLLTIMDLSSNRFSGEIPNEIGTLEGLVVLNMSNNELVGPIPQPLANLLQLESLDLSRNNLSGNIPVGLLRLTFLSVLNLSFNNLQGKIPEGNQFSTFDARFFEGNAGLCGPPLTRKCTDTRPIDFTGDRKIDFKPLYIAAESGFIVGLACVVLPLFLVGRVRRWWCGFVDTIFINGS